MIAVRSVHHEEPFDVHSRDHPPVEQPSAEIGLYLDQIARTPLLSRRAEIAAARVVERTRRRFRLALLSVDGVLEQAVAVLREVRAGTVGQLG